MQAHVRFAVLCPARLPRPTRGWRRQDPPPPFHSDVFGTPGRPQRPTPYGLEFGYGVPIEPTSGARWRRLVWHNRPCCFLHFTVFRPRGAPPTARTATRAARRKEGHAPACPWLRLKGNRRLLVVEPRVVLLASRRRALRRKPSLLRSRNDAAARTTHRRTSARTATRPAASSGPGDSSWRSSDCETRQVGRSVSLSPSPPCRCGADCGALPKSRITKPKTARPQPGVAGSSPAAPVPPFQVQPSAAPKP
jgi:hypothetical protein